MKRILFLICAVLAFAGMHAQTPAQKYAEQTQAKCPRQMSDGLTWESTAYVPDSMAIVITFDVDSKIVPFQALKHSADMMHEGKVAELLTATDAENTLLRKACADGGNTVKYVFRSGTDSFMIKVTPADLK